MSDKRYQVFISSTYLDLEQERRAVISALQHSRFIAVGMEEFMPNGKRSLDIIKKEIDNSDYYVIITKGSYGSTTEQGISYTETEYDYAAERNMPILAFAYDEAKGEAYKLTDKDKDNFSFLKKFLEKIKEYHVGSWTTKDDLVQKVKDAVYRVTIETPGTGWVRGNAEMTPEILRELGSLRSENAEMKAKLAEGSEDWKRYLEVSFEIKYINYENVIEINNNTQNRVQKILGEYAFSLKAKDLFIRLGRCFLSEPSEWKIKEEYLREIQSNYANLNNIKLKEVQNNYSKYNNEIINKYLDYFLAAKLIVTSNRSNTSSGHQNQLSTTHYTVYQLTDRGRDYYAQSVALLPENEITL